MSFGFHPVSKESQIRKVPIKQRKQNNKPEVHKGRLIPKRSVRGNVTRKEKNKALAAHGEHCHFCGKTSGLEAHHIRFRSAGGRGQWRNIRFLCHEHHRGKHSPHRDERIRQELENLHRELYGEWFWADVYDLFKAGLIENTTDEAFEEFMQEEEKKAAYRRINAESSEAAWF